jgi:hypothetical protein
MSSIDVQEQASGHYSRTIGPGPPPRRHEAAPRRRTVGHPTASGVGLPLHPLVVESLVDERAPATDRIEVGGATESQGEEARSGEGEPTDTAHCRPPSPMSSARSWYFGRPQPWPTLHSGGPAIPRCRWGSPSIRGPTVDRARQPCPEVLRSRTQTRPSPLCAGARTARLSPPRRRKPNLGGTAALARLARSMRISTRSTESRQAKAASVSDRAAAVA